MTTLDDAAASDLIAVMALIAVFVTAAAIAGVALLSYPPGDAAPAMIARIANEGESISIYHDGGDPLERGHFAILVDGEPENFTLIDGAGHECETWTSWETGQVLVLGKDVTVSENPHIQIVGEGVSRSGSAWLLHEIGNGTIIGPTEPTNTPAPIANFTANVTYGPAPLAVAFTDTSTGGPTSWHWDFGDDSTSTEQNPAHTYSIPGTYNVTLTARNTHGSGIETKSGYITVASPVIADFTANITSGEAPLAVQFTDLSRGDRITSWSWDFGDDGTSNEQNPVHTYTAEGTYNVTLTARNAYGNDTAIKSRYITVTVTEKHVSRLEVYSVRQTLIWWWWPYVPVYGINVDYTGDLGTGRDKTPFALSRTNTSNSSFNVTLTAPTEVTLLEFFGREIITLKFEEWQVGNTRYGDQTNEVSVPNDGGRTCTAYYTTHLFP